MKCTGASLLFTQIDNAITDIDQAVGTGISSSAEAYLARYLTVFISGVYEQAIEEIIWEYASTLGTPEIENFVANQLDKTFRNPDMGNAIGIIKQFSSAWADQLKAMDTRYKTALDSIINNKNQIAHGQSSLITINDIKRFHADATKVIEKIDLLFLGP